MQIPHSILNIDIYIYKNAFQILSYSCHRSRMPYNINPPADNSNLSYGNCCPQFRLIHLHKQDPMKSVMSCGCHRSPEEEIG